MDRSWFDIQIGMAGRTWDKVFVRAIVNVNGNKNNDDYKWILMETDGSLNVYLQEEFRSNIRRSMTVQQLQ